MLFDINIIQLHSNCHDNDNKYVRYKINEYSIHYLANFNELKNVIS